MAISYDYAGAGAETGYSEDVIRRAVAKGDLFPHYANSKPVILASDLLEWVENLPLEKPTKKNP